MRQYDLKAADGSVSTRAHIGPQLGDPLRLTKRLNDDQVVEIELDEAEVRALGIVAQALVKVRDEVAAAAAFAPAVARGAE
jgi:hypothetical protein